MKKSKQTKKTTKPSSRSKKKWSIGIRTDFILTMAQGQVQSEKNYFVGLIDDKIDFVAPFKSSYENQCKKFVYKKNFALIPGLVNGHTHLPMSLFRGIEDDVPLKVWLFDRIFPLESKFVDKKFVTAGVELSALECIRFGVTTINDMYFYTHEALKVWDKMGLRGLFSQVFMSFPTPEDKDIGSGFDAKKNEFKKLLKIYQDHSRLTVGLGPHAPYTCDDKLLSQVAELSQETNSPISIHVSETKTEVDDSFKNHKKSPVRRLFDLGLLSERTNCAHCVHLSEDDIQLLKKSKSSVTYNPDSNTKLSSGIAPIVKFIEAEIPVSLGTDGVASNNDLSLFGVIDLGTKLQKVANPDTVIMSAAQALKMATWEGAKALGLEKSVGSIESGKKADLVLLDLNFPHLQPLNSLESHLAYAVQGLEVDTVICDGKLLLEDKKFKFKNTEKVYAQAEKYRKSIAHELSKLRSISK